MLFKMDYVQVSLLKCVLFLAVTTLPQSAEGARACTQMPAIGMPVNFNPTDEICCSGHVYPKFIGSVERGCCGGDLYNVSQKICCNRIIHDRYINGNKNRTVACCKYEGKEELYSLQTEVCCSNMVTTFKDWEKAGSCCGSGSELKRENFQCCQHNGRQVLLHKTGRLKSCCGASLYDSDRHYCKKPEYILIKKGFHPCGETHVQYNGKTQKCCNGNVLDIPSGDSPNNWLCCWSDGKLFNRNQRCCPKISPPIGKLCCGTELYEEQQKHLSHLGCVDGPGGKQLKTLKTGEILCGNDVLDNINQKCCNNKPYNPFDDKCCNSEVIVKHNELCCGREKMDRNHVCCKRSGLNSTMISKQYIDHDSCCINSDGPVSFSTHNKTVFCDELRGLVLAQPKETRNRRNSCPYNKSAAQLTQSCNKKYNDTWKIMERRFKSKATLLTIQDGTGHKVQLRCQFRCKMFKLGRYFVIYTNKNLKMRTKANVGERDTVLRMKKKDQRNRKITCEIEKTRLKR